MRLGYVSYAVWCYGDYYGRWPDATLWRKQLIAFADEFSPDLRVYSEDAFLDAWDRPLKYKVITDPAGKQRAMIYSTGKNGEDDEGQNDDIVEIRDDDLNVTTRQEKGTSLIIDVRLGRRYVRGHASDSQSH